MSVHPIFEVPADAPLRVEAMGSKPKFWFRRDDGWWLFKRSRYSPDEDWAEVLAASCADVLGLPHAHYELATWRGERGVVTERITSDDEDLVHGNELLAERDPDYPQTPGSRHVRVRQHTLDAVLAVVGAAGVGLPARWTAPAGVRDPTQVFLGYLLLDAWIGNTDRHHENWGVVFDRATGRRSLAPTFDHATSLGSHETDDERRRRLASRDPAFRVAAYVTRARSALYASADEAKPLTTLEALRGACGQTESAAWMRKMRDLAPSWIEAAIAMVPPEVMSGPARAFASAMLLANRQRILEQT